MISPGNRSACDRMSDTTTFRFSEAEARRMRRGVFMFPLIVLPFVAVFGLDASKSQPTHFIIMLLIGIVMCVVLGGILWFGVRAQIANSRQTLLTILPDRLSWTSDIGQSELFFNEVVAVTAKMRFGQIRSLVLRLSDKSARRLEGYEHMDELLVCLKCHMNAEIFSARKGLHI
jgi:hypothetical protein